MYKTPWQSTVMDRCNIQWASEEGPRYFRELSTSDWFGFKGKIRGCSRQESAKSRPQWSDQTTKDDMHFFVINNWATIARSLSQSCCRRGFFPHSMELFGVSQARWRSKFGFCLLRFLSAVCRWSEDAHESRDQSQKFPNKYLKIRLARLNQILP